MKEEQHTSWPEESRFVTFSVLFLLKGSEDYFAVENGHIYLMLEDILRRTAQKIPAEYSKIRLTAVCDHAQVNLEGRLLLYMLVVSHSDYTDAGDGDCPGGLAPGYICIIQYQFGFGWLASIAHRK